LIFAFIDSFTIIFLFITSFSIEFGPFWVVTLLDAGAGAGLLGIYIGCCIIAYCVWRTNKRSNDEIIFIEFGCNILYAN
jgi:hypothetical protein